MMTLLDILNFSLCAFIIWFAWKAFDEGVIDNQPKQKCICTFTYEETK